MMKSLFSRSARGVISQAIMLALLNGSVPNAFAESDCKPLTGTYEYYGKMLNRKPLFDSGISLTPYFGFYPAQVLKPKRVVVEVDLFQENIVLVDVIGQAVLSKGSYTGLRVELPRRVELLCQAGRWFREAKSVGGVDGAYHENEDKVFLEKQHDGNILVDFYRKTVSGLFFKKTFEHHDELLFQKVQD